MPPGSPLTKIQANKPFTVQFQQNLNHFYVQNPGFVDASIAFVSNPQESDFQPFGDPIADYNSMNQITQTNFSITAVVPNMTTSTAVIRVRYVSNNPLEDDHGMIFYQCADVIILPAANEPAEPVAPKSNLPRLFPFPGVPVKPQPGQQNPAGCCTAQQWEAFSYEPQSWRPESHTAISYDQINKLMMVEVAIGQNPNGTTIYDGHFRMYMNFTNGYQWYYNVATGSCDLYGLDYWNDWCFGTPGNNQHFVGTVAIGEQTYNEWTSPEGDFSWISSQQNCVPAMFVRSPPGYLSVYFNYQNGIRDPKVFVPPAACHRATKAGLLSKASESPMAEVLAKIGHPAFAQKKQN